MNPIYSRRVKRLPLRRVYKGGMMLPTRSNLLNYRRVQKALTASAARRSKSRKRRRR